MSVTEAYQGFLAAAGLTVRHLHQALGLDLWVVTCVDSLPRPPSLQSLLDEVGAGPTVGDLVVPERQIVVAAAGPLAQRIPIGSALDWANSFCKQMLAGTGPRIAPDIRRVPAYARVQEAAGAQGLGTVRSYYGMPLRWADGRVGGTVCGYGLPGARPLDDTAHGHLEYAADMLSTVLATHERGYWRAKEVDAARALAETDPLTGLSNRRGWQGALHREQQRSARYGRPVSILAIDLDDLKMINDTQGHVQGDAALVAMAEVLRAVCRPADVVARTGGDEFVVLAVEADFAAGKALATRIRLQLHRSGVRASVGVSSRRTGEDLTTTTHRADAAMNAVKRRRHRSR